MNGIDISKNIGIKCFSEIRNICRPLYDNLDLTYFNYVKLNPDGTRSTITDRPDFIVEYYKRRELFETKSVVAMEQAKNANCRLSCEFKDQLSYQVASNDFNIDNGLTIILPAGPETELYYFGTSRNNSSKIHLYLSNVDMFYRFIVYFKDKAKKLIALADKERFSIDISKDIIIDANEKNVESEMRMRKYFYDSTDVDRFFINEQNGGCYLTRREAEALCYLMDFKTSKNIAKALNISNRTVEVYIENIKRKLGCKTKNDLLYKLINTELGKVIRYAFMTHKSTRYPYTVNSIT